MRRPLTLVLIALTFSGCVRHTAATGEEPAPQGPPEIQYEVVRQHATQFDVDLPDRPPGSQHELAAASYILGHLQLAGYSPRLDRVPVEDAVNSTNVVALPPNGSAPRFLIAVSYDTSNSGRDTQGTEIGLFLELARALTVEDPNHSVGFVALGAQTADGRGTRRLAQFLLDEGLDPSIILVRPELGAGRGIYVRGACQAAPDPHFGSAFTSGDCRDEVSVDQVLFAAGFQVTTVGGDTQEMGRALFNLLTRTRS